MEELYKKIRDIPDFPQKGIIFKDITPLIQDPETFKLAIDTLYDRVRDLEIDLVAGIEARGFIFAAPIAYRLNKGLIIVRKPGKLPYRTRSRTYSLEYGTDTVEMHEDAIREGNRVLIIDDLLATGGTVRGVAELIEDMGGIVSGCAFVIELTFLQGRNKLNKYNVLSLITY